MSHPMFDIEKRVARLTRAASGIRRVMTIGFAESGADVMLADVGRVQTAAHSIQRGRRAVPSGCDRHGHDALRQVNKASPASGVNQRRDSRRCHVQQDG